MSYRYEGVSPSEYSLGESMQRGGNFVNAGSATFAAASAKLTERVREELLAEQTRRAEADILPVPYAVTPEAMSSLQARYPEFSLLAVSVWSGVHSQLEAERMVATANSLKRLGAYAHDIVAQGNAVLPAAFLRMRGVRVEMSGHDPYAVHANHTAQYIYQRMARLTSVLRQDFNYQLDPTMVRDFAMGKVLKVWDRPSPGSAGAMFTDLSMNPVSVLQHCTGMASAGSIMTEVLIPYVPEMLIQPSGEWGDTGVAYEITHDDLLFKYTDGVAGAPRFPLGAWIEWLRSGGATVVCDGKVYTYEIELQRLRGPFMSATVTRVEGSQPQAALSYRTHALDFPHTTERYFVRSHRLKGLQYDPSKPESYEMHCYMPDKRVADKVFLHAMSLPKESFKDGAILKRVTVLDGRITFAGMSVSVDRPIAMDEVAQLTQDIVLRAFVARYNMGELGVDLMSSLNEVRGFAAASVPSKIGYLFFAMARCAWTWTVEKLANAVRDVVTAGLRFLTGRGKSVVPDFTPAPTFVRFETYTRWLSRAVYSKVPDHTGGNVLVPYLRGAREAYKAAGRYNPSVRPIVPVVHAPDVSFSDRGLADDIQDTREPGPVSEQGATLVGLMRDLNGMAESPSMRFDLPISSAPDPGPYEYGPPDYLYDASYISTINREHELAFPGMGLQQYEGDSFSLANDPQHRNIDAYMRFPSVGQLPPMSSEVYKSRVNTYRVERKQQTLPELVRALEARNLATPQISKQMNHEAVIHDTWENFLDMCCKPEAREMLQEWKEDRVVFEREALEEWTKKANPKKMSAMIARLVEEAKALEEYDPSSFEAMLKSDAKPPLDTKVIGEQLAPQVIVYHDSVLSAIFSSIFRVLTRRFLALLKPEWMLNLLKDSEKVRQHFTHYFPWDGKEPEFLENDFSKYDKSQGEQLHKLEKFVYSQLGFDDTLLEWWMKGHERSRVHSAQHALTLIIDWQRRSGGPNTSFGNGIINILTTSYVYRGSDVIAAVYIGDDSLLMCRHVAATVKAVEMLGDLFNLQAKFILSSFPYFASTFLLFDRAQRQCLMPPDPFKRVERLAVSVNAVSPEWDDRIRSHAEQCKPYCYRKVHAMLEKPVRARYQLTSESDVYALFNAIATSTGEKEARGCWEEHPSVVYRR